jgi:hypothetical protein
MKIDAGSASLIKKENLLSANAVEEKFNAALSHVIGKLISASEAFGRMINMIRVARMLFDAHVNIQSVENELSKHLSTAI